MSEQEIRITADDDSTTSALPGGNPLYPMGIERGSVDQLFLDYYGLNEQPFGVTPDLRFLYLGAQHRQALDVLNFGTELNRGFLTLIAKPGMGKTSLLFQYLEGLRDKARTAFLFQTDGDSIELMRYLLADLGLDGKGMDLPEMRAILSQVLMGEMQAGRRFVLVIDEAQNLDEKVLESIRLLSNFETPWMKLMHIVLAGQPQLAERLAKPSMTQLRQRVSFAIRLEPFTREEVDLYIDHRLWVAGYKGSPLFSVGARALLAERSEGVPRIINNICFCAMSFAWAMKQKTVDREMMEEVLADLVPAHQAGRADFPIRVKLSPEAKPNAPSTVPSTSKAASATRLPPPVLTLGNPPTHRWLTRVVVPIAALLILGWLGTQSHVDKWIGPAFRAISNSALKIVDPASTPVAVNPTSSGVARGSASDPKVVPSDDNRIGVTQQEEGEPSASSQ
jgi:type II secretory pathway predicted ATPase ExeA